MAQKYFRFVKKVLPVHFLVFCLVVISFIAGVFFQRTLKQTPLEIAAGSRSCLRLSGYTYIQPLLACDTTPLESSTKLSGIKSKLEKEIEVAKNSGAVTEVSVYLRDIVNREEISIDPDEKFFPASLKKIPVMMQYYKESETDPGLLQRQVTITDPTDYNADTAVHPREFPVYGKTYTNAELINFMITYSDNISFQVLLRNLGSTKFNQAYQDLQLHFPDNLTSIDDYMTPYQYSLFFRTLFNATYLNHTNSEAALSLISGSDYKNALAAGVPNSVKIAHKFGVGVVTGPDGAQHGELHDCGLVYREEHPYMLCIMTKSKSLDITDVEQTIASLSKTIYQSAVNNFE